MPKLYSFTCNSDGGPLVIPLNRRPDHKSRETSGVWVINNKAWKIFPNMNQWGRVNNDYNKAIETHLSTPSFTLRQGTITYDNGRTGPGFALVTTYITPPARFFALKNGPKLVKQLIESITDDAKLAQIERNLYVAWDMGLRDPQGFVDQYAADPIVFIDLHIGSSKAPLLKELYHHVGDRRAALQRQQRGY